MDLNQKASVLLILYLFYFILFHCGDPEDFTNCRFGAVEMQILSSFVNPSIVRLLSFKIIEEPGIARAKIKNL